MLTRTYEPTLLTLFRFDLRKWWLNVVSMLIIGGMNVMNRVWMYRQNVSVRPICYILFECLSLIIYVGLVCLLIEGISGSKDL
jgi:hypothetical protein